MKAGAARVGDHLVMEGFGGPADDHLGPSDRRDFGRQRPLVFHVRMAAIPFARTISGRSGSSAHLAEYAMQTMINI